MSKVRERKENTHDEEPPGCTIRCPTCGEPMWLLGMGIGVIEAFARLMHECDQNMYTHVSVCWVISHTHGNEEPSVETIYEICVSKDECKRVPVCTKIYRGILSNVEYAEDGDMIIKEYPCRCPLMGIPLIHAYREYRETLHKQPPEASHNLYILSSSSQVGSI